MAAERRTMVVRGSFRSSEEGDRPPQERKSTGTVPQLCYVIWVVSKLRLGVLALPVGWGNTGNTPSFSRRYRTIAKLFRSTLCNSRTMVYMLENGLRGEPERVATWLKRTSTVTEQLSFTPFSFSFSFSRVQIPFKVLGLIYRHSKPRLASTAFKSYSPRTGSFSFHWPS